MGVAIECEVVMCLGRCSERMTAILRKRLMHRGASKLVRSIPTSERFLIAGTPSLS
jgi:hypothetical protein